MLEMLEGCIVFIPHIYELLGILFTIFTILSFARRIVVGDLSIFA